MVTKNYTFTITASNEAQCLEAMTAASSIVKNLKHNDLVALAKTIKNKPDIIETARPFLMQN